MRSRWAAAILGTALSIVACSPSPGTTTLGGGGPTTTNSDAIPTTTAPATTAPKSTSTTADEATTTIPGPDVVVSGGTGDDPDLRVAGPAVVAVQLGDDVQVSVLSSVDDEIHVHGYDLIFEVRAGEVTAVEFVADVPGIFEVELEQSHLGLFDIEVTP